MMRPTRYLAWLAMIFTLTACAHSPQTTSPGNAAYPPPPPLVSPAPGRGNHAPAISGGNVAGADFGGIVGQSLSGQDRQIMQDTTQRALNGSAAGAGSHWKNPVSGHSGTITPQRRFVGKAGESCREYHQVVRAAGKSGTGYGTACRGVDGIWRIRGR